MGKSGANASLDVPAKVSTSLGMKKWDIPKCIGKSIYLCCLTAAVRSGLDRYPCCMESIRDILTRFSYNQVTFKFRN